MPVILAGALVVVVLCSGARLVKPGGPHGACAVPLDVEAWHGLMGLAMAAMLLAAMSVRESRVAIVVFGSGVVWCVVRMTGHAPRAAYLRLGACCTAMVAMLAPASVAASSAGASMKGMAGMQGMDMSGMAGMQGTAGMQAGTLPQFVVWGLLVTLAAVITAGASRLGVSGAGRLETLSGRRVQAAGEMVMAGAMACMLVGFA
jgi:hypothetical protein